MSGSDATSKSTSDNRLLLAAPTGDGTSAPLADQEALASASELLRCLAVAHTTSALYPLDHPSVVRSLEELVRSVADFAGFGFVEVTVRVYKNSLYVENQVFPAESESYRRFVDELLARGISAVTFLPVVTTEDAAVLLAALTDPGVWDAESAATYLAEHAITTIALTDSTALDESVDDADGAYPEIVARENYDAGVRAMRDVEMACKLGRVIQVTSLQRIVASLLDSLLSDPAAVIGLTAIKSHDEYTLNHSINVCILSLSLGAELGLDETSLRSLGLSALLYDLGKVRVPEEILAKQGPLTSTEWEVVRSHAEEGADLLKRIQLVDQMPMVVAYEHHQRHDLQGYPEPVTREGQHLFSKVVAISDAYDAMTTRRPFRREIRPDKALAVLMQGRGKAYDPDIVKAFVGLLGIYPMGAVVVLDDHSTGIVHRVNNEDLLRPRVKVVIDPDGRWLDEPDDIDLRRVDPDTGEQLRSVVDCVPAVDAGVDDIWRYL